MSCVRELAINALYEIWGKGKKPKEAIENLSTPLDKRDRAFLMELVYGVLRYRDTLDWVLKDFLKKPFKLSFQTLNNLRLGAYQILFMQVPEWAAVNEAVEIEKKHGQPELVNAVLRNLLRNREALSIKREAMEQEADDPLIPDALRITDIATLTSHPEWLIRRWLKRFGGKETLKLAQANNRIPPLTLRVNTVKTSREQIADKLKEKGIESELTEFSPDGIKLKGFHSFRELYDLKGYIIVQDEAAQLITYMLEPEPGERVLDACAAPGGKTTHIAQMMRDQGEIIAVESDTKRTNQLDENISEFGLSSVKVICADINKIKDSGMFDKILLDAPCSSLGVIRRNPDVKYRYRANDLLDFKSKQLYLLYSVSGLLRPGGLLVYSVCSTEPEEGESVVREFLKIKKDFYIIGDTVFFLKKFIHNGYFRTYPHRYDMDGFFGVKICRKR